MSWLRFKVGELARVAAARDPKYQGAVVQIISVGPYKIGQRVVLPLEPRDMECVNACDYVTDIMEKEGGVNYWICFDDWQLAKLDPPAEPESITRREEVEA